MRDPKRYTASDLFELIAVDPEEIRWFTIDPIDADIQDSRVTFNSSGRFHKWKIVGYVVNGDWDQFTTFCLPFDREAREHFLKGVAWEKQNISNENIAKSIRPVTGVVSLLLRDCEHDLLPGIGSLKVCRQKGITRILRREYFVGSTP